LGASIHRLPLVTASRIAAGEVIERPLSALKEIVENALDAGSRSIEVRVERALDAFFAVADDGSGIAADELELALERHATSKLASVEELDQLATLGFRGEALPSIAAVSRLKLVSRRADQEAATFVRVDGGQVVERGLVARAAGTTVEVRDLFHNTPARRKFLNSPTGELRAALRMIESYALARPGTGFRLVTDGRERFAWGPASSHRERAAQVWGAKHAEQLLEASLQRGGYAVSALLGLPEHARATREGQVLLVNGRWVQSPALSQALRHAYGNLLPTGRFPAAVLWLTVPPDRLDVNVHPTKREVRFADEDSVFSLVAAACAQPLATIHPPFAVVTNTGLGGGGTSGRPIVTRQFRGDGSGGAVQAWGSSYRTGAFRLGMRGTHPQGRGKVKLEAEYCPSVVQFGSPQCRRYVSQSWQDVTASAAGVSLEAEIGGLAASTLYRWRVRMLRARYSVDQPGVAAPPSPAHGPWRRLSGQTIEADVRTGAPGVAVEPEMPSTSLVIEGVRPNPARGSFAVTFVLPGAGQAKLEVFDVAGRRVLARDLRGVGEGRHTMTIDEARTLSAGSYLVRLSQAGRVVLSRVALLY